MSNANNKTNTANVLLFYANIIYEYISGYKFINAFRY